MIFKYKMIRGVYFENYDETRENEAGIIIPTGDEGRWSICPELSPKAREDK